MNVLVTGGAGFIGSHLCERLLSEGMRVSIIDELNDFYGPQEKLDNLDRIRHRSAVEFLQADICETGAVERLLREQEVEAVIHMAARVGVRLWHRESGAFPRRRHRESAYFPVRCD
jgi:UDP-glucuronate 4-epimerase